MSTAARPEVDRMDVTRQYFDGCPNWQAARDLVRQALRDVACASVITPQAVPTAEQAEAVGFRGPGRQAVSGCTVAQGSTP